MGRLGPREPEGGRRARKVADDGPHDGRGHRWAALGRGAVMLTPEQIRHLRATIERAGTLTTGGRYSAIQREGYWTVLDGNGVGFADVLLREEARGLAALLNALPGLLVLAEDLATLP